MSRNTKLTAATVAKVVQAIELGATYELAAKYAGIAESTFYVWMKDHPEFSEAVHAGEGKAAIVWLAKIEQAGKDDWRALAWKAERRFPKSYGKSDRVELTGKDGGAVQVDHKRDLSKLSDTDLDLLTALLAKADGEQH